MSFLKIAFWIFLFIIIYTYFIYTAILLILSLLKYIFTGRKKTNSIPGEPEVTLFVAAYNEKDCIANKIENSRNIDYPGDKLKMVWVTDGSDDGTPEILKQYDDILVFHEPERKGKIHAMNRGMKKVSTPIVIFSDANTNLNKESVKEIVMEFANPRVGCVAGEKKIYTGSREKAVGAGEGLYWQYESLIKRLESNINSTVGAAGELFAVRTSLYEDVEPDTILDDFTVSLRIAEKGYKIKYAPGAHACEKASFSIKEELKRKIRIASGGFQTLFRMKGLLNIFKHGFLSFEYISHKVFRWVLVPVSLFMLFLINFFIVLIFPDTHIIYKTAFWLQLVFYFSVVAGWILSNRKLRLKGVFIPYYIFMMNFSILVGMIRFFRKKHSAIWEKARRS